MVRLFKHYIPHAVLLIGVVDALLLFASAEIGWVVRAHQIHMAVDPIMDRLPQLLIFVFTLQIALVAVGAYGVASVPVAPLRRRPASGRDFARGDPPGPVVLPCAQPDLLALESAVFDDLGEHLASGRPRAARADAGG